MLIVPMIGIGLIAMRALARLGAKSPAPVARRTSAPRWLVTSIVGCAALMAVAARHELPLAAPGPSGTAAVPVATQAHVPGQVAYSLRPPAGGPHSPIWLNCGIYAAPAPDELAVHSLEHGAVWVTYDPLLPAPQVEVLRSVVRQTSRGSEGYVILSPYAGLSGQIVASAWGRQLRVESAADERLMSFVRTFRNGALAPERGGRCTGGWGVPTR